MYDLEMGLEFDDVLIKPVQSNVNSRDAVDISVELSDFLRLEFPLIASPMVGVVDAIFAHSLACLGGMAILHRFYLSRQHLFDDIDKYLWKAVDKFGVSVKVDEENFEEYFEYNPSVILVDTANGYTRKLMNYCDKIKTYISRNNIQCLLMSGNVVTKDGCDDLYNAGCDIIRVGLGGGSPCSTRNQTGIGIPNLTAIQYCAAIDFSKNYKIVIDGGIKNSGDFVKAVVAGAELGMAGKLFAECFEAPNEGVLYGMGSRTHMENMKSDIKSVEGFDTFITKKHSLAQFVKEFGYGIKSAGTYLNSKSLDDMYINGHFIRVTDSAIKKGL